MARFFFLAFFMLFHVSLTCFFDRRFPLSTVFKIKCLITVFIYLNFWLVVFLVDTFLGRGGLWWLVCCFRNDP